MTLLEPLWLLLAVPLVFALGRWTQGRPTGPWPLGRWPLGRWHHRLRVGLIVVATLALARPAIELPRRGGTVAVVVDRSASMPEEAAAVSRQVLDRLSTERGARDRLTVVSFAETATVDDPALEGGFTGFESQVGNAQSSLAEALETALAALPAEGGRLLVLSDGRWTLRDPTRVAARAAVAGVPIDYRRLEQSLGGDVSIERVDSPAQVSQGEGFTITAWVRSPRPRQVVYRLERGDTVLAEGQRRLPAGTSRLSFQDKAQPTGVTPYRLEVRAVAEGADPDPVPGNDVARFLVSTRGPRPVWVVSPRPALAQLLAAGGLPVEHLEPRQLEGSLEALAGASAVVLENVAIDEISHQSAEGIAAWVTGAGGGLVVTGGGHSYAPGGYFHSALDPILPVSMELRKEHRQLPLAIAIALDRSGSMAAPVGDGHTKMDLANLASVAVLDLLERDDELAVLAVDSAPHRIQPLVGLTAGVEQIRQTILSIDSQGGGIYVYEALDAALRELLRARAPVRHILLFADAADAEHPANFRGLLRQARKSGITVSVVGLGTENDTDAGLLREIAELGEGRIFFSQDPHQLPRIFAQDTFVVAQSSLVRDPTPWRPTSGLSLVGDLSLGDPPSVGGYNLTYLRPEATLLAVTEDTNEAPLAAAWQSGLGRVVALTAEVDGDLTGDLAQWSQTGNFLTSLTRWVAGPGDDATAGVAAQLRVERGAARVQLFLDPERADDPFLGTPRVSVLRGTPGATPERQEVPMRWVDPSTLEAEVALQGDAVVLPTVALDSERSLSLPPVRLPYNPELAPEEPGAGHRTLEALARQTGGQQRYDVGGLWSELPRRAHRVELTPWLALLATLLFVLEILERRTGWVSVWAGGWRPAWTQGGRLVQVPVQLARGLGRRLAAFGRRRRTPPVVGESVGDSARHHEAAPQPDDETPGHGPAEPARDAESPGVAGALAKARQRARGRRRDPG